MPVDKTPKLPTYLTLEEVARITRVPMSTVYAWVNQRRITTYRPGRRVLVAEDDLTQFLKNHERPALPRLSRV